MAKEQVDLLIIGAGPSGCVAAAIAHQQQMNVLVLEKQTFPRFVIGESLIPRCMDHLAESGLLEVVQQQGFQVKKGARFIRQGVSCTFDFAEQFTRGWTWTWQVPRAAFDKVLADEVARKGVEIRYRSAVKAVRFQGSDSTTVVEAEDGSTYEVQARFIIDASGYGRVLPRILGLDMPSDFPMRQAFFSHLTDPFRPEGAEGQQITFHVPHQDLWLWIIPFSNGLTSLGFVGSSAHFEQLGHDLRASFRNMIRQIPVVYERFEQSDFAFDPMCIKGYSKGVKQLHGPGFALTGNSAEFLDPIFSSGVTFATESGLLAARLACRQIKGEQIDWESSYSRYIRQGVDTFRSYVKAWYDGSLQEVFFSKLTATNPNETIKRQICSVLAGYVWDQRNPFVRRHATAIQSLAKVVRMHDEENK
ncbi:MAG: NAD(P)/FAD-dependent oxidoreductase [Bacteroidetes bacterium]|nr:MAG: NAD(P)/FAD-dependent oxidoreductase [Bacteroidota bacterium]